MPSADERLAVVETLVTAIREDISEVKSSQSAMSGDIKLLLGGYNKTVGAAGFFTRAVAVLALAVSAIGVALNMFSKGFHF